MPSSAAGVAAKVDQLLADAAATCTEQDMMYVIDTYRTLGTDTGSAHAEFAHVIQDAFYSARSAAESIREEQAMEATDRQPIREDPSTLDLFLDGLKRRVEARTLGLPEERFLEELLSKSGGATSWADKLVDQGDFQHAQQYGEGELCLFRLELAERRLDDASSADPAIAVDREDASTYPPGAPRPHYPPREYVNRAEQREGTALSDLGALLNDLATVALHAGRARH